MAQNKSDINAGYVVDLSFVSETVSETQELLKSLSKFRCVGVKITSHQDYKIKASVKASNVILSVFGQDQGEDRKSDDQLNPVVSAGDAEKSETLINVFNEESEFEDDITEDSASDEGGESDDK